MNNTSNNNNDYKNFIDATDCINKLHKLIGNSFKVNQNLTKETTIQSLRIIENYKKEWIKTNSPSTPYKSPYLLIQGEFCSPLEQRCSEFGLD